MTKYVYFAQADYGGPIKVGCSCDRDLRVQVLSQDLPFNLVLIGWVPGGFFRERFVQAYFREYAIRREWFQPAPELLRWAYQARTTGAIAELPPDLPENYVALSSAVRHRIKGVPLDEIARLGGIGLATVRANIDADEISSLKTMAAIDAALFRQRGVHVDWLNAAPYRRQAQALEAAE